MSRSPAELFAASPDLDAFAAAVRALDGEFPFDAPAMIALGEAYFSRYPERPSGRDLDAVRLGYEAVRACAVEKVVRDLPPGARDFFRECFADPGRAAGLVERRLGEASGPGLLEEAGRVAASLDAVKAEVDLIPRGRIKERFVGGISLLYNVLYLVRMLAGRGPATT